MKSIVPLVVVAAAVVAGGWWLQPRVVADSGPGVQAPFEAPAALQQDAAREAFEQRANSRQLTVSGRVTRLLADDRDGSPHQRFIIATDSGLSLLVAHNIALAPRLDGLAVGDRVEVFGEYEWNDQGGVMHWTHDDPQHRHIAGYVEWRGRRYQ